MIKNLDKHSSIPLLIAVDEEGGKVVRVSSNPLLVATPFKSSKELYRLGGLSLIEEDTIIKSNVLNSLGFKWPEIDDKYLEQFIGRLIKKG